MASTNDLTLDQKAPEIHVLNEKSLIESHSRYNENHCCTIEKVEFLPDTIRVHINIQRDDSLGPLQSPMTSSLGIVNEDNLSEGKQPVNSNFSISDENRQYSGYLDFPMDKSFFDDHPTIGFKYGSEGYSTAKLFHFNMALVDKFNLKSS